MSFSATFQLSDLNGTNGFQINGVEADGTSGFTVASAGDVNGDGFDDIVITARHAGLDGKRAGESYFVFGAETGFAPVLNLTELNGNNGFKFDAPSSFGYFLTRGSVASAGDVNGDGIGDVIIGAAFADPGGLDRAGESYVVFGTSVGFEDTLNASDLDGTNGFTIEGKSAIDLSGYSVASAGDVNGDGVDDIIIGAPFADPDGVENAGESYVVFGAATGLVPLLNVSDLNGDNGFRFSGVDWLGSSGNSVSSVGDVNGDGFDDVIIGAPGARSHAGESYVIFGKAGGFDPALSVPNLNGNNGFRIYGANNLDSSGFSVASAGDMNGDGYDDIIIGARGASVDGKIDAGESYIVFGGEAGFPASLSLADLDGENGFTVEGIVARDASGYSVSSAGDVNGDGFDDIIIGAPFADPDGIETAGESYVIFGGPFGFTIPGLTGTNTADILTGTDQRELIEALDGNDWILPDAGSDWIDGGDGIDMVSYANQIGPLTFTQNDGTSLATIADMQDRIVNAEGVTGTSQADTFHAAAGYFRGLGGQDTFVASGTGLGHYDGGSSRDTVSYETASSGISASLLRDRGWGGDAQGDRYNNIENLIGSSHDDFIWGDHGNNRLEGGYGDDVIEGNDGDDYILAGVGTDTIVFSGNRDEYTITQDGIRTEVIHNGGGKDGHDVIGHAEVLRFADGDLFL